MIDAVRIIGRCQNRPVSHEYSMFRGNLFDMLDIIDTKTMIFTSGVFTCFCGEPIDVVVQCLGNDCGGIWKDMFTSPQISDVIQSALGASRPDTGVTGKVYHSVDEIVGDMNIPTYILDNMQKTGLLDALRSIEIDREEGDNK